jgi:ABC-type glycerol-3-phosphate transport system substrate-binding protein
MDYIALTGKRQKNSAANNANIYGIWTLGISQFSTEKERAAKLLSHLMDRNVQMASLGAGGVPCRYSSLRNEEYLRKYPQYAAVCDALENGVYRPVMERWNEFYAILGKHMKEIIEGDMPIRDGLLAAQRELNEAFGTSASQK